MKKMYKLTLYSDNGASAKRDIIITMEDRRINPKLFYRDGVRPVFLKGGKHLSRSEGKLLGVNLIPNLEQL
ncbi:hypothetical protein SAMN05660841_02632 [Sphingobacterium nematocida]|uniref:Uncharacterized protein n=1 Tax=Sphingobacterium nematocida TaxID=1513896 RepID=A0A1T5EKA6_9SPHI|nr:hypothetical protein [Sphingobacterium nematocida]SKB84168.1 hypothetical protein SAMN05660841_02632 [Sphingobacterium nematocida]